MLMKRYIPNKGMDIKACGMASATISNIKKNAPNMPMPEIVKDGLERLKFQLAFIDYI